MNEWKKSELLQQVQCTVQTKWLRCHQKVSVSVVTKQNLCHILWRAWINWPLFKGRGTWFRICTPSRSHRCSMGLQHTLQTFHCKISTIIDYWTFLLTVSIYTSVCSGISTCSVLPCLPHNGCWDCLLPLWPWKGLDASWMVCLKCFKKIHIWHVQVPQSGKHRAAVWKTKGSHKMNKYNDITFFRLYVAALFSFFKYNDSL